MISSKSRLVFFVSSLLFFILLTGCNPSADAFAPGTFQIDPSFSDFYREFGGTAILGPAISPSFEKEGVTYQYIVSGLMVYDPIQIPTERFHFSPIASMEWNINDLVEPAPPDSSELYINGHRVWEELESLYNRYGLEVIGLPVTGVRANDTKQRYEQYFEGLGFYRNYSDQPGQIQLLPYGLWMCGANCQYEGDDLEPPEPSYIRDYSETEQLFLQASERLGYGFTGAPIESPIMAEDGYFEMTFENVVMYFDPSAGNLISLRPLPSWLGIPPDKLTGDKKSDWLAFYHVDGGLGYNIPKSFGDYIEIHGGMSYSGAPITEYRQIQDGGYTQCYTNICLEYHPTAPEQLRIRPLALGVEFHRNGQTASSSGLSFTEALQINAWEQYPLIASGQKQIINIEALKNNTPVTGIKLSLVVQHPDGIIKSYQLNPTGEGGKTSIELDPINGPNGAIVQYQICLEDAGDPLVCFSRSYTIWNQ